MRIENNYGDTTDYKAYCIVNTAKFWLLGGGGADDRIYKKAGNKFSEFCKTLGIALWEKYK